MKRQKRSKDGKIYGKCTNGTNRRSRVWPVCVIYIIATKQQCLVTSPRDSGVVSLHVNAGQFSTTAGRVTSPTWGPPPPCKQALILMWSIYEIIHGFESRWSLDFFFRLLLSNCLNWKIYCDGHSSLWGPNIHNNFHSEWVLGLVIDYAWISKLCVTWHLHDGRKSCDVGLKGDLFRGVQLSEQFLY